MICRVSNTISSTPFHPVSIKYGKLVITLGYRQPTVSTCFISYLTIKEFGWVTRDSFEIGATLDNSSEVLRWESNSEYYRWDGSFPKVVPSGSTPATTGGIGIGAWVGIGDASLRSDLMSSSGSPIVNINKVTVSPQGNLSQSINWVTPEQFGAIGDGTVHPLSERYATLAAAQAVYPHVTSLNQTIDWAACQGAENYARGVTTVKCPTFTKYHFGSTDYLALGVDSKWQGSANPQWHSELSKGTTMIRTSLTTAVQFGKDAVVRVMDASDAGSPDEAVRGISFKGFYLSRGRVGRRFPTKGTNSICLHMNMAIKAEIDVAVAGAEFGFFGYGCWGTTGIVRIDSCHKGYYVKPDEATPERPVASGTITALDLRLEIDATPFPITMSNTYYSKINGFFEGVLVGMTNYDSANETAIGLDINGCSSVFFELGIESFQGIHTYARNGNSCTIRYFPYGSNQDGYLTTTGTQTSDYTIKTLMGTTPTILPLSSRAYNINNGGNNIITFLDTYWYLDTVAPTNPVTHHLFHGDVLSSWILIGGGISATPASGLFATVLPVRTNNLLRMIKILGVRFGNSYFAPSGYEYVSEDLWRSTSYKTAAFTIGSPSTVTVTTPTGFKFREIDVFSNLGATAAASSPVVIGNLSDTSRTYVCASTNTGLALRWKDYISVAV